MSNVTTGRGVRVEGGRAGDPLSVKKWDMTEADNQECVAITTLWDNEIFVFIDGGSSRWRATSLVPRSREVYDPGFDMLFSLTTHLTAR